jgi:hypothetical protein
MNPPYYVDAENSRVPDRVPNAHDLAEDSLSSEIVEEREDCLVPVGGGAVDLETQVVGQVLFLALFHADLGDHIQALLDDVAREVCVVGHVRVNDEKDENVAVEEAADDLRRYLQGAILTIFAPSICRRCESRDPVPSAHGSKTA